MTDVTSPPLVIPQLIVGLGNPGSKYEQTRHNVGFMVIDALAQMWGIALAEHRKFQGQFGEGLAGSQKIRLLKPTTFMNNSGQSMRALVDWYKLPPAAVLVVYDEMALPLGTLRLRLSGSAGGHNGMKSAIAHLGSQDFPRLRIGIGAPKTPNGADKDTISHVLGTFSKAEAKIVTEVTQLVTDAIALSLKKGVEQAMNLYNNRSVEL
jgi:peptidyl-tRNA hydrolase, PTH1 family